jgi:hypothetical protein
MLGAITPLAVDASSDGVAAEDDIIDPLPLPPPPPPLLPLSPR